MAWICTSSQRKEKQHSASLSSVAHGKPFCSRPTCGLGAASSSCGPAALGDSRAVDTQACSESGRAPTRARRCACRAAHCTAQCDAAPPPTPLSLSHTQQPIPACNAAYQRRMNCVMALKTLLCSESSASSTSRAWPGTCPLCPPNPVAPTMCTSSGSSSWYSASKRRSLSGGKRASPAEPTSIIGMGDGSSSTGWARSSSSSRVLMPPDLVT
mmetsp:Transcript_5389/g.22810  ORF Transcript_5389/g.22810 Transcript_5389/m.22810 type:complete len:213 (-) Transcript_5389:3190-3828(-)